MDGNGQVFRLVANPRTPDRHGFTVRRLRLDERDAVLVSLRERGGVDHQDISKHVVVDVAAQDDQAALLESHGGVRMPFVYGQLEVVRVGERIDVMGNGIAVRKLDRCAGLHHEQMRHESLVHLVHDGAGSGRREPWPAAVDVDGYVGHRLALTIEHGDAQAISESLACRSDRKNRTD